jgi:hypothetical protein
MNAVVSKDGFITGQQKTTYKSRSVIVQAKKFSQERGYLLRTIRE